MLIVRIIGLRHGNNFEGKASIQVVIFLFAFLMVTI